MKRKPGTPISLDKSVVTERSKKNDMLYNTNYIQFRKNFAVIYSQSELARNKKEEIKIRLETARKETYKGQISAASKKLIRKKLSTWFEAIANYNSLRENVISHKLVKAVFLTVTLSASQYHSDKEIKARILKPFIRKLRDDYGCERYLWKAEKQSNGNIHFHIIIDQFIDKLIVQILWNKCQEALGYITEFEKKYKRRNPPSTQIQVISNTDQMMKYIEKYICKDDNNSTIEGAIWKCSKKIFSLEFFELPIDQDFTRQINEAVGVGQLKLIVKDRYKILLPINYNLEIFIKQYHSVEFNRYQLLLNNFLFHNDQISDFKTYKSFIYGSYLKVDKIEGKKELCKKVNIIDQELPFFDLRRITKKEMRL
jgi:hypothetical protein